MLVGLTLLVMGLVAVAHFREGLFSALTTLINFLLAAVVAFNFWEPLADILDPLLQGIWLAGFEDWLTLVSLFGLSYLLLRLLTAQITDATIAIPAPFQELGGAALGLLTGYLLAGFLLCTTETLPWPEDFLGFGPRSVQEPPSRRWLPSDRAWLSLMRHLSTHALANQDERLDTSDPWETFELRYLKYRRQGKNRPSLNLTKERPEAPTPIVEKSKK